MIQSKGAMEKMYIFRLVGSRSWRLLACVCMFRRLFQDRTLLCYYTCEDQQSQNACSHDFEVIFEPKNVVLVSGFLLGYG